MHPASLPERDNERRLVLYGASRNVKTVWWAR